MPLEKTGLQIVAEGADRAIKEVSRFDQAVAKVTQTIAKAERSSGFDKLSSGVDKFKGANDKLASVLGNLQNKFGTALDGLTQFSPALGKVSDILGSATADVQGLATSLGTLPVPAIAAAVAVAGVAAALTAIIKLGARGAQLQITAQAFGNIVGQAGDATAVLDGLRKATRGAVSDFELMRLSTLALQGQQRDFKNELLAVSADGTTALGRVIDATRRIAQTTGQNEVAIREKFLYGLRLQSKLRLDDVGVMVDQATAERTYAEALGVSTAALTEQQKKAAFAREALRQLDEVAAGLGERSTALDDFARPLVVIRNILDKLAVSVVPAFEPIAAVMAAIANAVESMANLAFPIIERLGQLIGNLIGVALLPLKITFFAIKTAIEPLLPILYYQIAAWTLLLDAINAVLEPFANIGTSVSQAGASLSGFGGILGSIVGTIGSVISSIGGAIAGIIGPIASAFNSITTTIASALNNALLFMNAMFATMVFSAGQWGGALTGSYAAGLLRGGTKVTEAVTKIASIIADFLEGHSPPKVGPLSRIDEGGFNVAKTWAEGFQKGFVRPVDTIRNEITAKLGAIGDLVANDLEQRFKALDVALLPFNEQLQLAKAQVEQIAGFVDPALKAIDRQRNAALKAFAQGKATADEVRQYDMQLERLRDIKKQGESITDQAEIELAFAKSAQAVERAKLEIQKKRLEMFGKEATAAALVEQMAKEAGGGAGAATKAQKEATTPTEKALTGGGGGAPINAPSEGITTGTAPDILANTAIDNARQGIIGFFNGLGGVAGDVASKVGEAGGQFGEGFASGFAESGFDQALNDFNNGAGDLHAQIARIQEANPVDTIAEKFAGLADILTAPLTSLNSAISGAFGPDGTIATTVSGLFAEDGIFGSAGLIATAFTNLFGEGMPLMLALGAGGTIATGFIEMAETVKTTISGMVNRVLGIFTRLQTDLFAKLSTIGQGILNTFTSPTLSPFQIAKTTVAQIFDDMLAAIGGFANTGIVEALSGIGATLSSSMVMPFVNAVNAVIDAFNDAINSVINGLPGFLQSALEKAGITTVNIGHIGVPGAARGGLNLKGLTLVGEEGPELLNIKRPSTVFPANLSSRMLDFMSSAVSPIGAPLVNNVSNTYNQQKSINASFNGYSVENSILALREMQAL